MILFFSSRLGKNPCTANDIAKEMCTYNIFQCNGLSSKKALYLRTYLYNRCLIELLNTGLPELKLPNTALGYRRLFHKPPYPVPVLSHPDEKQITSKKFQYPPLGIYQKQQGNKLHPLSLIRVNVIVEHYNISSKIHQNRNHNSPSINSQHAANPSADPSS